MATNATTTDATATAVDATETREDERLKNGRVRHDAPYDGAVDNGANRSARDPRMWSAFGLFFVQAFAFAAWLPRLPELKDRFDMTDGDVGLVLLALPVGLLTVIPIVGYASTRVSLRTLNLACMGWMLAAIPLVGLVDGQVGLAIAILLIGMGAGSQGVAMNAAGFAAEEAMGRPILSRCHAMYSLGLAAGGLVAGLIASVGVPIAMHLAATNAVLFVGLLVIARAIVDARKPSDDAPTFALPTGALLVPGLIAMGCLMAEGVAVDWSSIFLADVLAAPAALVGAGVATFSGAMAAMRFAGDWIAGRMGERAIVGVGALVSALGYALTAAAPNPPIAFVGFVLVGVGLAPIVPVAFRMAGRLSPNAPGVGVAAVSTLGYAGFLLGPAVVGLVSEATNLRWSFVAIAALLLTVAALSRRLTAKAA